MADTGYMTIQQAFQTPFVVDVISQLPTPDYALQRFYRSMRDRTFRSEEHTSELQSH